MRPCLPPLPSDHLSEERSCTLSLTELFYNLSLFKSHFHLFLGTWDLFEFSSGMFHSPPENPVMKNSLTLGFRVIFPYYASLRLVFLKTTSNAASRRWMYELHPRRVETVVWLVSMHLLRLSQCHRHLPSLICFPLSHRIHQPHLPHLL